MKQKMMWLLMGLCTLAFSACGSDDDNSGTTNGGQTPGGSTKTGVTLAQAVGTWEQFHESGYVTLDGVRQRDFDEDTDPDWLVIKADGSFEYWEYSTTSKERHQDGAGMLIVEDGYVVGRPGESGIVMFTSVYLSGNVLTVSFVETETKSGKEQKEYITASFRKVK